MSRCAGTDDTDTDICRRVPLPRSLAAAVRRPAVQRRAGTEEAFLSLASPPEASPGATRATGAPRTGSETPNVAGRVPPSHPVRARVYVHSVCHCRHCVTVSPLCACVSTPGGFIHIHLSYRFTWFCLIDTSFVFIQFCLLLFC